MRLSWLLLICFSWCPGAQAQILVAARDSPERYRDKADFVCGKAHPEVELQAAVELAVTESDWGCRPVLDVAPGHYRLKDTVYIGYEKNSDGEWEPFKNTGCDLRGVGQAVLYWVGGKDPGKFMVEVAAKKAVSHPTISGLYFNGARKVSGIHLSRWQGSVKNLAFCSTAHYAVYGDGVWFSRWENLSTSYCHGAVFVLSGFNGGTADVLRVNHCDGSMMPKAHPAAIYVRGGNGRVTSVQFENNQYAVEGEYDYPGIYWHGCGTLEGVRAESGLPSSRGRAINAKRLIVLDGCRDLAVRSIQQSSSYNVNRPETLVTLRNSKRVSVDGVWGSGHTEALVRVEADCVDCEVNVNRVHDGTAGSRGPKHLVDFAGKGK